MAKPVLVRAYTNRTSPVVRDPRPGHPNPEALPPVSSYAFADILRSVDGRREFQTAIDGIAEIYAKSHMSLAHEHASHLPPLGEITVACATSTRRHALRPGLRPALTSVPEASSTSSDGSRHRRKKKMMQKEEERKASIFSFCKQEAQDAGPMRRLQIGTMGRFIDVGTTTAMAREASLPPALRRSSPAAPVDRGAVARTSMASAAVSSLQRVLTLRRPAMPV